MICTDVNLEDTGNLDSATKAIKDIFASDNTCKIVKFDSGPKSLFVVFETKQMAENALKVLRGKKQAPHVNFKRYQSVRFAGNK